MHAEEPEVQTAHQLERDLEGNMGYLRSCLNNSERLGWRDGSAVKITDYYARGLRFSAQHPQLSITPDPENLMPSSDLHSHCLHMVPVHPGKP